MRAAMAGDAPAYAHLLRDLAAALRPVARSGLTRAGRSAADAEDIVQEILLAVHLKRHTWDTAQPFGPWVRAIARYKLIDALRKRGSRYDVPIDDLSEILPAEEDSHAGLAQRDIDRHLETLPQGQRVVVRTIAVEGVSLSEAAAKLNMTQGAVRVALHRGLSALARNSPERTKP